jgi:ferrous iron transport protein A
MPKGNGLLTLSEITTGEQVIVRAFQCGHAVALRLASLGFTPGVMINMIQNHFRGPLIVLVRGTRIALGRGEARKIIVERDHDE